MRDQGCCAGVVFGSEWQVTCLGSHKGENLVLCLEVWPEVITGGSKGLGRGDCGCVWALSKFFTEIYELSFKDGHWQMDPLCQCAGGSVLVERN